MLQRKNDFKGVTMNTVIFLIFPKIYRDFAYYLLWFPQSTSHSNSGYF